MEKLITLGADEEGQVYGLKLNEDGSWRHNPLGYPTSCDVIRPVSKGTYEYVTEDPESAKELWKQSVDADRTELGLAEWFEKHVSDDDLFDTSSVFELLDDEDNPTVRSHNLSVKKRIDEADDPDNLDDVWDEEGQPISFREHLKKTLLESPNVDVSDEDDIYTWESSGWFPPKKPFAVEFAPKELLEEYYAHLRKIYEEFEG